jgi:hypothetical protein
MGGNSEERRSYGSGGGKYSRILPSMPYILSRGNPCIGNRKMTVGSLEIKLAPLSNHNSSPVANKNTDESNFPTYISAQYQTGPSSRISIVFTDFQYREVMKQVRKNTLPYSLPYYRYRFAIVQYFSLPLYNIQSISLTKQFLHKSNTVLAPLTRICHAVIFIIHG